MEMIKRLIQSILSTVYTLFIQTLQIQISTLNEQHDFFLF